MFKIGLFLATCALHTPADRTVVVYKNTCGPKKTCYAANCRISCRQVGKRSVCTQTCQCFCRKAK